MPLYLPNLHEIPCSFFVVHFPANEDFRTPKFSYGSVRMSYDHCGVF